MPHVKHWGYISIFKSWRQRRAVDTSYIHRTGLETTKFSPAICVIINSHPKVYIIFTCPLLQEKVLLKFVKIASTPTPNSLLPLPTPQSLIIVSSCACPIPYTVYCLHLTHRYFP